MKSPYIKVIVICVSVAVLGYAFLLFTAGKSGDMVFPRPSIGTFIETPRIVESGGKKFVQWTISESCRRNGYEVRTPGYRSGDDGYWAGREDGLCEAANGAYQCRSELLDEMAARPSGWVVQAASYDCSGGRSFVSQPVEL